MDWTAQYVGAPFEKGGCTPEGWDCYGLVRYVYAEHLGVVLPKIEYVSSEGSAALRNVAGLFDSGLHRWRQVKAPAEFNVVLLKIGGYVTHCGVYTESGKMLHVLRGCETSVIRTRSHLWQPTGFYEWRG